MTTGRINQVTKSHQTQNENTNNNKKTLHTHALSEQSRVAAHPPTKHAHMLHLLKAVIPNQLQLNTPYSLRPLVHNTNLNNENRAHQAKTFPSVFPVFSLISEPKFD